jgi:hypothetical protein
VTRHNFSDQMFGGGSGASGSAGSVRNGMPRIRFNGAVAAYPDAPDMDDVEFVKDEDYVPYQRAGGAGAGAGGGGGGASGSLGTSLSRGDLVLKNPEDMTREELLLMFKTTTAQGAIDNLIRTVSTKTTSSMVDDAMTPMSTISMAAVATRDANRAAKLPYHEPLCVPRCLHGLAALPST